MFLVLFFPVQIWVSSSFSLLSSHEISLLILPYTTFVTLSGIVFLRWEKLNQFSVQKDNILTLYRLFFFFFSFLHLFLCCLIDSAFWFWKFSWFYNIKTYNNKPSFCNHPLSLLYHLHILQNSFSQLKCLLTLTTVDSSPHASVLAAGVNAWQAAQSPRQQVTEMVHDACYLAWANTGKGLPTSSFGEG